MATDPRAFVPIDSDAAPRPRRSAVGRLAARGPRYRVHPHPTPSTIAWGLIQVSDGHTSWLVDPLAARDLTPLIEVFRSPGIKILHSASEDMEVFFRALGVVPEPLFDNPDRGRSGRLPEPSQLSEDRRLLPGRRAGEGGDPHGLAGPPALRRAARLRRRGRRLSDPPLREG